MNNVRVLRQQVKLTLQEVADRVGTTKSHIWNIENNKQNPSLQMAYRIAGVLGKSIVDVFPDEDEYEEETVVIKTRRVKTGA